MNQNDLRVVKTKENIYNCFFDLLKRKPLYRITVQELCEKARINKGTFYYHYEDIYALYNEIMGQVLDSLFEFIDCYDIAITQPTKFLQEIRNHEKTYSAKIDVILQDKTMSTFKDQIIDEFIVRTYKTGVLKKSSQNDARLYTLYNTILEMSPRYDERVAKSVLEEVAKGLFSN